MLNDDFFPLVIENQLEAFWFQKDRATRHTANEIIALLQKHFGDKVISSELSSNMWNWRSAQTIQQKLRI